MSDPDYARVRDVFHQVCELNPAERDERVRALCGDDEALHRDVARLLAALDDSVDADCDLSGSVMVDQATPEIEGYRVIRLLGEGGMGVVYEAEQERPHRRVAIKLIRPGFVTPSIKRRFEREADALGRLKHPGIAQVYEAQVAVIDGRRTPYLVMELVEGPGLLQHARAASLTTRQRLSIALKLCDAVEHAHQRGVIHRDLKPANILVDATGQPKILDFGVARMTQGAAQAATLRTEAGQILGTAAYMSPEQAGGDPESIDTRSDVYSLGVVIFELLTDQLPHRVDQLPLPDAIRVIREDEPTRASTIMTSLRGDVDTILAKALERDADRRYQSAAALGADIRRLLRNEPIEARAPSTAYQLRKFARRHRALVAGVCAVIAVLAAGLAATGAALMREADARQRAEVALERSNASSAFLEQILLGLDPRRAQGRDTELLLELLDDAAGSLNTQVEEPIVRAAMLSVIGRAYHAIFAYERAAGALEEAARLYDQARPAHESAAMGVKLPLADALANLGRDDEAEHLLNAIIESAERRSDTADQLEARQRLAELTMDVGRWDEALVQIERAEALTDQAEATPLTRGRLAMLRGAILRRLAFREEARESYTLALELFRSNEAPIEASMVLNSLAVLARDEGRREDAERFYRESIDMRLSVDARPNPDVAASLANLGRLLVAQDRLEEAEPILTQSVEMHQEFFGDRHFAPALPMLTLAELVSKRGGHEEAIRMIDDSLIILRANLPPLHPITATALLSRGEALTQAGRFAEAATACRRSWEMARALELDGRHYLGPIQMSLAAAVEGQGRTEEAIALLSEAFTYYTEGDQTAVDIQERIDRLREKLAQDQ